MQKKTGIFKVKLKYILELQKNIAENLNKCIILKKRCKKIVN